MVKRTLEKVLLFLVLIIVGSSFSGCGGENVENAAETPVIASSSPVAKGPLKSSDYPPLVEKAAQADMQHLDGTTSKVSDRKGKVLLLNIWATWCGPCLSEIPQLVKMQDTFRDKGFEIIGLNADDGDTKEKIEEFSTRLNINYTVVWAPTDMQFALFKVSKFDGIPQSFVIDRDGRLRGVFKGASQAEIKRMETTVAKVVNE